jgi:cyclase
MFNELEADELSILDIDATIRRSGPNYELVEKISSFCLMPLSYGGGISSVTHAEQLFRRGVERVSINSALQKNTKLITDLASTFGSQAIRASLDVRKDASGKARVWFHSTKSFATKGPLSFAKQLQDLGAGEVCITAVDKEGTWSGPDLDLAREISEHLDVPVLINGGVNSFVDLDLIRSGTQSSGVGVSSLFLFQKPTKGVLVGIPDEVTQLSSRWF